jgi:hypothetical protein
MYMHFSEDEDCEMSDERVLRQESRDELCSLATKLFHTLRDASEGEGGACKAVWRCAAGRSAVLLRRSREVRRGMVDGLQQFLQPRASALDTWGAGRRAVTASRYDLQSALSHAPSCSSGEICLPLSLVSGSSERLLVSAEQKMKKVMRHCVVCLCTAYVARSVSFGTACDRGRRQQVHGNATAAATADTANCAPRTSCCLVVRCVGRWGAVTEATDGLLGIRRSRPVRRHTGSGRERCAPPSRFFSSYRVHRRGARTSRDPSQRRERA